MRLPFLLLLVGCDRTFPTVEAAVESLVAHDLQTLDRVASAAVGVAAGLEGGVDVEADDALGCAWTVHVEGRDGAGTLHAEPAEVPCGGRVDHDALDVEQTAAGITGTFEETEGGGVRVAATGDRVADVRAQVLDEVVELDGTYALDRLAAIGEHDTLTQLELRVAYADLAGTPGALDATGTAAGGWSGAIDVGRGSSCLVAGSLEAPTVACGGALGADAAP